MVVKFSVPMWFQIKRHSYMTDSPHNTFVCLQLLKHLNDTEINIVKEVVQKNAFFAHPDLPCAMCTDRNKAVGREAVNKIRKLRNQILDIKNEAEAFLKFEEDDERLHIDKNFVIPTDDEAEEDTEGDRKDT